MSKLDMGLIPTEEQCLKLLEKYKTPEKSIEHAKVVTELVKKLVTKVSVKRKIAIAGAMLIDIGKTQTQGLKHGFIGGRILRKEIIDESVISIVEKHIGVGITKIEATRAGLPPRDFVPETMEEKLVSYADKLVIGTYVATPKEAKIEFASHFPPDHSALKRWDAFMSEMRNILGE